MNYHNFSYLGHESERCEGVYCTRQIELPERGLIQVFVLNRRYVDQTAILHNPKTAKSALHAVLADQSISTSSKSVLVFVIKCEKDPLYLTRIEIADFSMKPNGELAMAPGAEFCPGWTEPDLAKCLGDLLACIPMDRSD